MQVGILIVCFWFFDVSRVYIKRATAWNGLMRIFTGTWKRQQNDVTSPLFWCFYIKMEHITPFIPFRITSSSFVDYEHINVC